MAATSERAQLALPSAERGSSHDVAVPPEDPAWVLGGHQLAAPDSDPAHCPEAELNLLARLQRSIWFPVLSKGIGVAFVLLVLSLIGSWSTLRAKRFGMFGLEPGEPTSGVVASQLGVDWVPDVGPVTSPSALRPGKRANSAAAAPHGNPGLAHPHPKEKSAGITDDGKVILNLATEEDLTRLPGVGKRRAETIIKLRTKLKRFRRKSDLLRVRGIGVRSLKRLSPLMVLDAPPPPKPEADAGAAKDASSDKGRAGD